MKAFRVVDFDKPAMFCEIPRQQPQHGQVEVKIEACGLNFADLLMQKNQYQDTPCLPFTMGLELSGKITSIGPNTKSPEIGTRVTVFSGQGGLAEYGYFPVERLVRIPEKMPSEIAAGFQIAYGTSHVALKHCANLNKNNTLLVLGAAGGVGLTALELGKYFGAYVIAAARGREKLKIAEKFGEEPIPRPEHWGGYRIRPTMIEFWQGRPDRLHDRLRYTRGSDGWLIERLAP